MKAITYYRYGPLDVLSQEEVEKPTPGDREVLVKIHAASINWANVALVKGKPFLARLTSGLFKPTFNIPGSDFAGTVETTAPLVEQFQAGDEVYGDSSAFGFGAFSEYVCIPDSEMALKPSNMTFEQSAAVPQAALVALQGLRDVGQIREGQKVLIHGASGGNGSFAVQIAKAYGAEVTAVCSTANLDLVRSLGAEHVIDYTREDFSRNGKKYDLIFTTSGNRSILDYKRALASEGIYVVAGGSLKQIFQPMLMGSLLSIGSGKKLCNLSHHTSREDLIFMKDLMEAGKVTPVIDRTFPLTELADALRYYDKGHSRGKVVISVSSE